jgi:hypothetical protein
MENGVVDTNWYGTFLPLAETGFLFSHQLIDVVKGKSLGSPWFQCLDSKVGGFTLQEVSGRIDNRFFRVDPEPLERPDAAIVVSEIMFQTDNDKYKEWVELYNRSDSHVSLEGWDLITRNEMTVSRSYCCALNDSSVNWINGKKTVAPGGIVLLVRNVDQFNATYPGVLEQAFAETEEYGDVVVVELKGKSDSFNMANSGGTVWLRKGQALSEGIVTGVRYESIGQGIKNRSVERISCSVSGSAVGNWRVSLKEGGTPGRVAAEELRNTTSAAVRMTVPRIQSRDGSSFFTVRVDTEVGLESFSLWLCDRTGSRVLNMAEGIRSVKSGTSFFHYDFSEPGKAVLPLGLYFVFLQAKGENGMRVKEKRQVVISR